MQWLLALLYTKIMHHTLLTEQKKKGLHFEQIVRTIIVLCFGLSLAGVIGLVSMVPVLVKINQEESNSRLEVEKIASGKNASQAALMIKSLNKDQILIKNAKKNIELPILSDSINSLNLIRGKIKLNSISFSKLATSTVSVSLQGISPNRDELIAFKSRIEALSPLVKVNLPISELTKVSNFVFSLQIQNLPI